MMTLKLLSGSFRALVSGQEMETWPIRKAVRSAIRAARNA
jgi:hypothetical protein